MRESPIFVKSFETITWVLEHTRRFPKDQRFVMAKRIEEAALVFHDSLLLATKPGNKRAALHAADFHLDRLRIYNRLAVKLRLSSLGQYEHLARLLDELGRLLGGGSVACKTPPPWAERVRGIDGRVVRGGSWNDDPRNARASARHWVDPADRNVLVGVRCAQ